GREHDRPRWAHPQGPWPMAMRPMAEESEAMMRPLDALIRALDQPAIDRVALPVRDVVRQTFEAGGPAGRQAKDALHGVWLGHPLHPVLTDIPLGAWTAALALDAAGRGD